MDFKARESGQITAVIPVRAGSSRCKNKNIRPFGDTNLLKLRIEVLKQVPEIDHIVVNTSDETMLTMAQNLGVNTVRRDAKYSHTDTSGSDLYYCLSSTVNTPLMMLAHCVTPFVRPETYSAIVQQFRQDRTHSALITAVNTKQYMFYGNGKPVNFDVSNQPPSQHLPDIYVPTFGCHVIETRTAHTEKTIMGQNPGFYEVSQQEGIDIDTPFDFKVAELLYINKVNLTQ